MRVWVRAGWVAVGLAACFALVSLLSRHSGPQRASRPPQPPARALGTSTAGQGQVRILHFYGMPGAVERGESVSICYGVENARSVRLEPPLEPLKPHWNRCLKATPQSTTTYTLTAEGADGSRATASFTIQVLPPPPRVLFVEISSSQIRFGEALTICYGVQNATSVRLEPLGMELRPAEKECVRVYPPRTLKFTLSAHSADGRTDREQFTVRVIQ